MNESVSQGSTNEKLIIRCWFNKRSNILTWVLLLALELNTKIEVRC